MTAKQKKTLCRIIIVLALFIALLVCDRTGRLDAWGVARPAQFFLYLIPYLIIGYDVIIRAAKNIRNGQVFDENFLMMVATFAAFAIGEYAEALAVMLFYQIGELFQSYAVGKSRQSIADMMSIAPEYANVAGEDGALVETDPEDVEIGAIIVVKPGEKIPLDGVVIKGASFLDTAALTGESVPRSVAEGDDVVSGCVNKDGVLHVRVTKAYEDSTVAKILDLVENASNKKARMENFITRFAKYYTPVVTIGALALAVLPPILLGGGWMEWVKRACVFLIVSCPCALVISVPLGFFGGIGAASKRGVLVKGSNYLEAIAEATTVVFDKTGTLTKGAFQVTDCLPANETTKEELLELAAYAESYSTHPIAASIRQAYGKTLMTERVTEATEEAGRGVSALYDGKRLLAGSAKLLTEQGVAWTAPDAGAPGTTVFVAYDGAYRGAIVISDTIKEEARDAIAAIKAAGVRRAVMLTGDKRETAEAVASAIGIDETHAELLPADKVSHVEMYLIEQEGTGKKTAFVGDGVNDAPVLMRADVGVAMGSLGSDAAIEAADIVLMDDNLTKIADTVKIARKTMRIVRQNIAFALAVKFLVLALGALGFATMWAAVFADVGVAVLAILNAMRALSYTG